MPRGGKRTGAGRRVNWKNSPTTPIRIPECLVEKVLQLAHALDRGEIQWTPGEEIKAPQKPSREICLNGKLRIYKLKGQDVLQLTDLNRILQSLTD